MKNAQDKFLDAYRCYIVKLLRGHPETFCQYLSPEQKINWGKDIRKGKSPEKIIDFNHLKSFALHYILANESQKPKDSRNPDLQKLPTYFENIAKVRNAIAHNDTDSLTDDDINACWHHMKEIAKMTENSDLLKQLEEIHDSLKIKRELENLIKSSGKKFNELKLSPITPPQKKDRLRKNIIYLGISIVILIVILVFIILPGLNIDETTDKDSSLPQKVILQDSISTSKENQLTDYFSKKVSFKIGDRCLISIIPPYDKDGRTRILALRNRALTQNEIEISNSCPTFAASNSKQDTTIVYYDMDNPKCTEKMRIDKETTIGSIKNGKPVIFLGKSLSFFKIKNIETNEVGFIAYKLSGHCTLGPDYIEFNK